MTGVQKSIKALVELESLKVKLQQAKMAAQHPDLIPMPDFGGINIIRVNADDVVEEADKDANEPMRGFTPE
jgi:hypothetical protein